MLTLSISTCEMEAQEYNTSPLSLYYQIHSVASAPLITGKRERMWVRQENQKLLWLICRYHLGDQIHLKSLKNKSFSTVRDKKERQKVKLHKFILFSGHYTIYSQTFLFSFKKISAAIYIKSYYLTSSQKYKDCNSKTFGGLYTT